ncbi:MAG: hypothetical protein LBU61_02460 [Coriobacteriales bacterium]|jgi:hypothetical protein|nr:hypothetical protein [Coriobacteriales bacterium]
MKHDKKTDSVTAKPLPDLRIWLNLLVFILIIGGLGLTNIIAPNPDVLVSERRQPAQLPALSLDTVLNSRFMNSFENYTADNFIFREQLRTIRSVMVLQALHMSDKDGLYIGAAGAGKITPINATGLLAWASLMEQLQQDLATQSANLSFYYAIIPDKSLYDERALPGYDPDLAADMLSGRLPGITAIDLTDAMIASDYYRTDLHWDQAQLGQRPGDVVDVITTSLGCQNRQTADYTVHDAGEFTGVYPGQLALNLPADRLRYLNSPFIDKMVAHYLDPRTGEFVEGPVYDLAAGAGRDGYDLFLRGAQPLVIVENTVAQSDRELYIFRDSYTSSLAPLLATEYARVTLIDLRYIDYRVLPQYVSFTSDSDVLFLYGSQILNDPSVLLIR